MQKLTKINGVLLEGCVWDEKEKILYFIDIECRKIYAVHSEGRGMECMELPEYVGCVVLEEAGTLVAALVDGLYRIDFQKRRIKKIMDINLPEGIRFNDGKCDLEGRLWVGSMAIKQDDNAVEAGSLYCIQNEKILAEYKGYTIPNGLDWEKEQNFFYHVDTALKRVERYRIGEENRFLHRTTVVDLEEEEGSPDGMCMDSEGNLWIAMWGGGEVIGVNPEHGTIISRISVPDRNPSCCTFGGMDMKQLFITTARDEDGNGGEVYVQEMDVKGVKVNRYGH